MSSEQKKNETYYFLPDGTRVPESRLPALGYVELYPGKWVSQADLLAASQAQGFSTIPATGTPNYWGIVNTIITTGLNLTNTIINSTAEEKKQLIADILFKYTVAVSANYDANFPYTENQLQQMTNKQLKEVLAGQYPLAGFAGFEQRYFRKTIKNC